MQLRYVASELGQGLKRNVTMTIAVVLTIWISLTLVGLGLLIRAQVNKTQDFFGSQLEVRLSFCSRTSVTPGCVGGQATPAQEAAVKKVLDSSSVVTGTRYISRATAYNNFVAAHTDSSGKRDEFSKAVREADIGTGYWIKVRNLNDANAVLQQVQNMQGVDQIINLAKALEPLYTTLNKLKWMAAGGAALLIVAAVLQVSNTIRLAAMARRREIGIMRLVGASSAYIQLPFLLEVLVSALVGAGLACGTLALFMQQFIPRLRGALGYVPWVQWSTVFGLMAVMVAIALALAIVPTLVMTRKYLKV
jgi:cell division transport system permease protein